MRATVRTDRFISDAELYRIGEDNPGWKVERIDGGVVMSPTNFGTDLINVRFLAALVEWGDAHGYLPSGSSGGLTLANRDVLSPDGGLLSRERWNAAPPEVREGYSRIVPDVVVELASPSDSRTRLRQKCARWHNEGAAFVVMIDPETESVETWGTPLPGLDIDWHRFARMKPGDEG